MESSNLSRIKTMAYINQKSGKVIKEKKEFDNMREVLDYAKSIKKNIRTYTFRICTIFKGNKEGGDVVSWDGRSWGGSHAVDML